MIYFIDEIIVILEYQNNRVALFLDLAKIFDSISRGIFFKKTENFNPFLSTILIVKPLNLFSQFDYNAKKNWVLTYQTKKTFIHGVPQGLVVFLLYFNNFSEKLESENDAVQFVNETSTLCKFESIETIPQNEKILNQQTDAGQRINSL